MSDIPGLDSQRPRHRTATVAQSRLHGADSVPWIWEEVVMWLDRYSSWVYLLPFSGTILRWPTF